MPGREANMFKLRAEQQAEGKRLLMKIYAPSVQTTVFYLHWLDWLSPSVYHEAKLWCLASHIIKQVRVQFLA